MPCKITNRRERLAVQGAISRFETVYGLSTQDIKIGDMGNTGALACAESDSGRVVIHKELLNTGRMESMMRKN